MQKYVILFDSIYSKISHESNHVKITVNFFQVQ